MCMTKSNRALTKALRSLDNFRQDLEELAPEEIDCAELEGQVQALVREIGRACMEEVLAAADTDAPMIEVGGRKLGNRRISPGTYATLFGEVVVERSIYSPGGGGRVAVPLDMRLGMVEGRYTPLLAGLMAKAIAYVPSHEAEDLLNSAGIGPISRSTLHRVPQAMSARYEERRDSINDALREASTIPEGAATVQVGIDGVMVPQDGEHSKPRGRKTKSPSPPRHEGKYASPVAAVPADNDGSEGRAWHEATVGTVSYWDADGNRLSTTYVGRMPESGQGTAASELEQELHAALAERPDLDVNFVSDGDAHQWILLNALASTVRNGERRVTASLDFFHAAEYVHEAAAAAASSPGEAAVLAAEWKTMLEEYEDGPYRVLRAIRYQRDQQLDPARRDRLDKVAKYLSKQSKAGRMAYKQLRDMCHPIGSGVVEAAAKTLISVRMKRAGARYSQHGGQTILTFRAALKSSDDRFPALCAHLHSTYKATFREAA